MKRLLVIAGLLILGLAAQDYKLMILDRSDTEELKSAYQDYKAAQKQWESVKARVAKRYTTEHGKTMEGWDHVQFSTDFRAVVPVTSLPTYSGSGLVTLNGIATTGVADLTVDTTKAGSN